MDCCGGSDEHEDDCTDVTVKEGIDAKTVEAAKALESENYSAGFSTEIETEYSPKGLSEDTIRFISAKKEEPEWLLEWRLAAYRRWLTMEEPTWAMVDYPTRLISRTYYYYAAPVKKEGAEVRLDRGRSEGTARVPMRSWASRCAKQEVLLAVEGAAETAAAAREVPRVAVDAVFDSVSVATTFRKELEKATV